MCLRQNKHRRPFHKLFAITCVDYTDKKHVLRYFSELWHHPFSINSHLLHFGLRAVLESFPAVTGSHREAAKRVDRSPIHHKKHTNHSLTPSGNSECPINSFVHLLLTVKLLKPQPTYLCYTFNTFGNIRSFHCSLTKNGHRVSIYDGVLERSRLKSTTQSPTLFLLPPWCPCLKCYLVIRIPYHLKS